MYTEIEGEITEAFRRQDFIHSESLKHVVKLQLHVNEIGECELESTGEVNSEGDTVVIHKVAGIIRKCTGDITFQSDRYDSSRNMETTKCKDNFDQNEQTIDGRNTTHSIAVVLYQRSPMPEETPSIPRTNQKTARCTEL